MPNIWEFNLPDIVSFGCKQYFPLPKEKKNFIWLFNVFRFGENLIFLLTKEVCFQAVRKTELLKVSSHRNSNFSRFYWTF